MTAAQSRRRYWWGAAAALAPLAVGIAVSVILRTSALQFLLV